MKPNKLKLLDPKYLKEYYEEIPYTFNEKLKKLPSNKDFSIKDFEFYFVASALFSSKIEGNRLDFNSFYRNRGNSKLAFRKKDVDEVEDLVTAYKFAVENELNHENILRAHKILAAHLLLPFQRGRYRQNLMYVQNEETGEIVYEGPDWKSVPKLMEKLFMDIKYLLKVKLTNEEVFYYASMLHLWFVKIHPLADGNGRSARLLEKWFLVSKLGNKAWSIMSERYYWNNRNEYYKNVSLGATYYDIDWNKSMSYLVMLPLSVVYSVKES